MKILIIGVNGFIASNLAKYLAIRNYEVYGISSKKIKNEYCIDTYEAKINEALPDFNGFMFDCVVHMAYDQKASVEHNIHTTIAWASNLKNYGVKKQIFMSSISAISPNDSKYAIIKNKSEKWFLENEMYVLRPGLVVGNGGLFASMAQKIKKLSIIPLINNGSQNIKYIALDDLLQEILNIISDTQKEKVLNLFYLKDLKLRELLLNIAMHYKKKVWFVNIPYILIFSFVRFFELLHVNIGINSSNVKGLIQNQIEIKSNIDYTKDISIILQEF